MSTYSNRRPSATVIPVAYAASVVLDMSRADLPVFEIGQLTGNIAISFSNYRDGQTARVLIKQHASSAKTVTWDSAICTGSNDLALPALDTTVALENLFGISIFTRASKPVLVSASVRGFPV